MRIEQNIPPKKFEPITIVLDTYAEAIEFKRQIGSCQAFYEGRKSITDRLYNSIAFRQL